MSDMPRGDDVRLRIEVFGERWTTGVIVGVMEDHAATHRVEGDTPPPNKAIQVTAVQLLVAQVGVTTPNADVGSDSQIRLREPERYPTFRPN